MEEWQLAILILVSVLVGVLIPVLIQLRATLRAAELMLKSTVPRVEQTLDEVSKRVAEVAQLLDGVQTTTRVMGALGASIGPAIVAGLSSYRAARPDQEKGTDHEQGRGIEHRA